jgi:hypothetical protein
VDLRIDIRVAGGGGSALLRRVFVLTCRNWAEAQAHAKIDRNPRAHGDVMTIDEVLSA